MNASIFSNDGSTVYSIGEKKQMSTTREKFDTDEEGVQIELEVETFDPVPFEPSDTLKAAIAAGHVSTKVRTVEVRAKDKDGNPVKVYRGTYTQCTAKNEQGALALPGIEGDEEKIWDFVSSRADAGTFQNLYVKLRNAAAGPEKAIAKMAKLFEGLSDSQKAAAREALKAAGLV